jgi:hypothetical protein
MVGQWVWRLIAMVNDSKADCWIWCMMGCLMDIENNELGAWHGAVMMTRHLLVEPDSLWDGAVVIGSLTLEPDSLGV